MTRSDPTTMPAEPSEPGPRSPATAPSDGDRGVRATDVAAVALLALVVRIPAYFAQKGLTFDDGVFANSVIAMRDGGVPFRDVFSSQGPLFLPLAFLGDLVGLRTLDSPRVLAVVSGVAAVVAIHWAASQVTDRVGALLAGALAALSGALAWVTGPLAADGPALAFAAVSMGLALRQRDRPRLWRAALIGLTVGAVLCTKSLEAPILIPVALVLAGPFVAGARRGAVDTAALARGAVAGAVSVAVFLAVSLPLGFSDVWDQSVRYRTDAASDRDIPATAGKLLSTLWDRDLVLLWFGAISLVLGVRAYRRSGRARVPGTDRDESWWSHERGAAADGAAWSPSGRLLACSWLIGTLLWLTLVVSPLWRPHVAAVTLPAVLVLGIYRPPTRVVLAAALLAVPMVVVQLDGLLAPADYTGRSAQLVEALRELPEGAWVLSDDPGVVWRAGRRTTDDLVDPSMLRLAQGRYTVASVAAAASDPRVCAVVITSGQRFGGLDGLPEELVSAGYEAVPGVGDGDVLYERRDCAPTS